MTTRKEAAFQRMIIALSDVIQAIEYQGGDVSGLLVKLRAVRKEAMDCGYSHEGVAR